MLTFQCNGKNYAGASALDVVRAIERDTAQYPHGGRPIRQFLRWSLERLYDSLPPRDLDLRDEYGAGKLSMSKARAAMHVEHRQ